HHSKTGTLLAPHHLSHLWLDTPHRATKKAALHPRTTRTWSRRVRPLAGHGRIQPEDVYSRSQISLRTIRTLRAFKIKGCQGLRLEGTDPSTRDAIRTGRVGYQTQ